MPKKLQFQVVHVSGYDNGHGPKELEVSFLFLRVKIFKLNLNIKDIIL